jgi:hypothetical protein
MYFPPSQIKSNQYTSGNEFVIVSSQKNYIGYYFAVGTGRFYTGKNPNNPPNEEITPYIDNKNTGDAEDGRDGSYGDANLYTLPSDYTRNTSLELGNAPPSNPIQISPIPTKKDYQIGEFQRYFVKKANDTKYIEINLTQYLRFAQQDPSVQYELYIPFQLPWVISGNISNAFKVNQLTVERKQNNLILPGFKSYFKGRYSQYFKYTTGEILTNLSTDGTEFKNKRTGKPYKGLYHVHPDKGPMVGAEHIDQIHDYLVLIDNNKTPYVSPPTKKEKVKMQRSIRRSGGY